MSTAPAETAPANVAAALSAQARSRPDAPAIHYPTGVKSGQVQYRSASYTELDALSDRLARGLNDYGIIRGMRVALMVPPGLEFFALFFALFKAGTVPVLIDPGIGLKPLKSCLREAQPEAFIGSTKAQLARTLFRWAPASIRKKVTIGPRLLWGGVSLAGLRKRGGNDGQPVLADTDGNDMAAILFTSGSTGIPKGVVYRHRHFLAQVELLKTTFQIRPGEVDLATFPPFALFDPALGMTTVVPHMDPTRPASANPHYLVQALEQFRVTNLFGSPSLLRLLARHAEQEQLKFPRLKRAISAGAAVPISTLQLMRQALGPDGKVHTPYGATECLPVSSISSEELDENIAQATREGAGICVGPPVATNQVRILRMSDEAMEVFAEDDLMPAREIGEIMVHGPTTTDSYWRRETQTRLAKIKDQEGRIWHRMGDAGYLDESGRIWYCGRKSQRVQTAKATLYPDQVEAIFNAITGVERCALVGVGHGDQRSPVLCIEKSTDSSRDRNTLTRAVLAEARRHPKLQGLERVLYHPGFPVDIRHNSKIGREELSHWAEGQLS